MKKYLHLCLILLACIFSASCQSTHCLEKNKSDGIFFGSGGGFSGQEREYILGCDGSLKMKEGFKTEITEQPSPKRSHVKKLFKQIDELQFDTVNFRHPGNLYYFIRYKNAGKIHEVVWGDPQHVAPVEIREFYETLISTTKGH